MQTGSARRNGFRRDFQGRQPLAVGFTGFIYDVTNTYLYGRHCPLGKPPRPAKSST